MKRKMCLTMFALISIYMMSTAFMPTHPAESMEKLMKQMLVYIKNEKQNIEANQPMLSFPSTIHQVSKAKIHKGKKISDKHQQYVEDFFKELRVYEQAKDSVERKTAFNLMVNSCVNCHKHECPGPVMVIEKNLLH